MISTIIFGIKFAPGHEWSWWEEISEWLFWQSGSVLCVIGFAFVAAVFSGIIWSMLAKPLIAHLNQKNQMP
jgi:hypothetical protein